MDPHPTPPGSPVAPATSAAVPSPYDRRGSSRGAAAADPLELPPPEPPRGQGGGLLALVERIVRLWPLWAALTGAVVMLNAWSGLPARVTKLEEAQRTQRLILQRIFDAVCDSHSPSHGSSACTQPLIPATGASEP